MSGDSNSVAALLASITKNLNQGTSATPPPPVPAQGGNAAQSSSVPPPSSYPAPPPVPSYSAPPPAASGGFDLSHLKPASSGTIPPSYGGGPSSAAPSGYDDRRDPYARASVDRYADPYASRRGDDRDRYGMDDPYARRDVAGMGRSRSRSPGRRHASGGGGNFGGSYGGDARDDGEKTTDTMMIDQGYVGLIIGKKGDTLRRIEQTSGCRVQFVPENQTRPGERACNLVGTRRQCETARRLIDEVVDDNIALKGPLPGARHQARAGYERMGHAPQSYTPQPAYPPSYGSGPPPPPQAAPMGVAGGDENLQIMVPDKTVGLIIGRGGENVKELQNKSRAKINITTERESVNGMRPINILGSRPAVEEAKRLIFQIVTDDEAGIPISRKGPAADAIGSGRDSRQEVMRVPQDAVGMIIGRGGETVRDMQQESGCLIKVSTNQHSDQREITLTGSDATIARARVIIQDKVDQVMQRDAERAAASGGGGGGSYGTSANAYPTGGGSYGAQSYGGASASGAPASGAAGGAAGGAAAAADPYAAYGGYDNYVKAWQMYQSQQAGGAPK